MNSSNTTYVPFDNLFEWSKKSSIGSREGKETGKYRLYVASATEIKYYDTALENAEALVFGTGGNPCIHYVSGPFAYTNHTETAKKRKDSICTKFYYYFFQKDKFKQLQSTFVGSGIKNSSKKKIGCLLVPVPPLAEQQRIVERIEELFSLLDSSVENLKKAKEQLAVYRQAVLKEAFENYEKTIPIRKICEFVTSGSRGWAQYYSKNGARFVRITDLTRDDIVLKNNNIQCVSVPEKAEGKRSRLKPNDILVSITADLGSIALIPSNIGEAYINQHIAMIRLCNPIQSEFIAWYLKSDYGQKDLLKNKRGGGKLGLGLDDVRDTFVPLVDNNTALRTVENIHAKMSVCESIENTIDTALQQADAMRQSFLKQAFEGGL